MHRWLQCGAGAMAQPSQPQSQNPISNLTALRPYTNNRNSRGPCFAGSPSSSLDARSFSDGRVYLCVHEMWAFHLLNRNKVWRGWGLMLLIKCLPSMAKVMGSNQRSEMTHTYNYNTWKVKAKGLEVQSQPRLHRKLEASLDYTDTRLKKKEER